MSTHRDRCGPTNVEADGRANRRDRREDVGPFYQPETPMPTPDFTGQWTLNVEASALSPVVAPVVHCG
jgi:hypothetical protein